MRGTIAGCMLVGLLLAATPAQADLQVQTFTEGYSEGTHYVTAYDMITDPGRWEAKVDKTYGVLYSFKDLTDAGVQSPTAPYAVGDHVNYLGTDKNAYDTAYYLYNGLFEYVGKSGGSEAVFNRSNFVTDVTDRLSFALSPDKQSYTITYTETAGSSDFIWDPDAASAYAGPYAHRGDVLTTVTITLNAATSEGTIFRMQADSYVDLPPDEYVKSGMWRAYGYVRTHTRSSSVSGNFNDNMNYTYDEDETAEDGPWGGAGATSFGRSTIDADDATNQNLGLTPGRTFILDLVDGMETGYDIPFKDGTDGISHYVQMWHPGSYSVGTYAGGTTRTETVDLRIDIVPEPATMSLLGLGLAAMAASRTKRRK